MAPSASNAFRVTVEPGGRSFAAPPAQFLLDAALDAGIRLPYGCRSGVCGSCRSALVRGEVAHDMEESAALSEADRQAGRILPCRARPLSDLVLRCREVAAADMPVRTLPCRVQQMERVAEDVMILRLRLPTSDRLQFLAGQYVEFLLRDGRRRAFSIANAPQDDALLELHVARVPGGGFTGHVFDGMKEKDILRIEGPHGSFRLVDSAKPVVLLAGGTGFAPIKSLVEDMIHRGLTRPLMRPIALYWGARRPEGLYLPGLPERWAAQHGIRYVPVISEPAPEDGWSGRAGLAHQAVLDDHADLASVQVYACGSPAMIAAARDAFLARGLAADDFIFDSFTFDSPLPRTPDP